MSLARIAGILAVLLVVNAAQASPSQTQLEAALANAETVWGPHVDVRSIQLRAMGDCESEYSIAAWSDPVAQSIDLNKACAWDHELVRVAMLHEYGHLVLRSADHSPDPRSVMYYRLERGQQVTAADREWLRRVLDSESQ